MKKRRTLSNIEFTPPHSEQSPASLGRFIGPSVLVGGPSASWVRFDLSLWWTLKTNQLVTVGAQTRTDIHTLRSSQGRLDPPNGRSFRRGQTSSNLGNKILVNRRLRSYSRQNYCFIFVHVQFIFDLQCTQNVSKVARKRAHQPRQQRGSPYAGTDIGPTIRDWLFP